LIQKKERFSKTDFFYRLVRRQEQNLIVSKTKRFFYKYMSLRNMECVLDIVFNDHLYCARWDKLNDPMEACYEVFAENESDRHIMDEKIKNALNNWRVVSLGVSNKNFLLWSHYADGHKGIAIEIEIPRDHPYLEKVKYDWATTAFSNMDQIENRSMRDLLWYKKEEWHYEEEYRIIIKATNIDSIGEYFILPNPIKKIFIGFRAKESQVDILKKTIGGKVKLVHMDLDKYGSMKVCR
jgi:hypothetical protein